MSTDLKRRNIPFSPPDMTEAEVKEVSNAILSGWITTGPRTKKLEALISEYVHTNKTVCLNSATAAMEIVLHVLGVVPQQQVYCGSPVPFIEGETWNEFVYRISQLFSLHGQNKDALAKTKLGAWEYDIIGPWYKCNMTDIMAALGLVQFERYPEMLEKRQKYVQMYNEGLNGLNSSMGKEVVAYLNHKDADHCSSHHLYLVRLVGRTREEANKVIEQMAEKGIACNVHYKPLPMMTAYKALGFDIKNYPNAFKMFENEITLPLNTKMSEEDVDYVIENFVDIVKAL